MLGSEWAPEITALLAADGLTAALVDDVELLPARAAADRVAAVVIAARHLGLKECLVVHELRLRCPETAIVLVSSARRYETLLTPGGNQRHDGGAAGGPITLLSWPANAEALRRVLRRARDRLRHPGREHSFAAGADSEPPNPSAD
jgi:hypothetical protein